MGNRKRRGTISLVNRAVWCGILLCLSIITGCTKYVYLPVYKCPAPVLGDDPVLAISYLEKGDNPAKVILAYSSSLESCKGRVVELKGKLHAYRSYSSINTNM